MGREYDERIACIYFPARHEEMMPLIFRIVLNNEKMIEISKETFVCRKNPSHTNIFQES